MADDGTKVSLLPLSENLDDDDLFMVVEDDISKKAEVSYIRSLMVGAETIAREAADQALGSRIDGKQDILTFDDVPTEDSDNPVTSGGIYNAIPKIEANPSGEATEELSKLQVDTTIYKILATKVHGEASGDLITINDAAAAPVKALSVTLEPQQDLHGYDHPWAGGAGKNLMNFDSFLTRAQQTFTVENDVYTIPAINNKVLNWYKFSDTDVDVIVSVEDISGTAVNPRIEFRQNGSFYAYVVNASTKTLRVTCDAFRMNYSQSGSVIVSKPMIRLATETDSTFVPYENICPISGWTECKVVVSQTEDAKDGITYTIQLGSTCYGGELDVKSGVLMVDRAYIDMGSPTWRYINNRFYYNPTNAKVYTQIEVGNLLCSQYPKSQYNSQADNSISSYAGYIYVRADSYSGDATAFKTAMNGVQLVYELATPIPLTLTPTQIDLLRGINNLWSDGEVYVKYLRDLDIFLNDLARTVADHEARITALENPNND